MNATHRITAVLVSAPLMLGLGTAVAAADPSGDQGQPNASNDPNDQKTAGPTTANGLVSVFAHTLKDTANDSPSGTNSMGQHSSNFAPGDDVIPGTTSATGRVGVGNLGRTDGLPGDDANSHFTGQLVIGMNDPAAACLPPGNNTNPNRGNPNSC